MVFLKCLLVHREKSKRKLNKKIEKLVFADENMLKKRKVVQFFCDVLKNR